MVLTEHAPLRQCSRRQYTDQSPRGQLPVWHTPPSTSGNAKEGTAAETATVPAEIAAPAAAAVPAEAVRQAEETSQFMSLEATQAEVTHQGYKNTRVSVTILKRHEGQEAEHIHSFNITDPTFEKEIFSELIAYGEEDDTGIDENNEPLLEIQAYDDDPEGPNLHVEKETEVINIGTAEEVKEVRVSAQLSPHARAKFIAFLREYPNVFA